MVGYIWGNTKEKKYARDFYKPIAEAEHVIKCLHDNGIDDMLISYPENKFIRVRSDAELPVWRRFIFNVNRVPIDEDDFARWQYWYDHFDEPKWKKKSFYNKESVESLLALLLLLLRKGENQYVEQDV